VLHWYEYVEIYLILFDRNFVASHEVEANKFWAGENVNRRRISSAISQLLAKSHSLTNARRVSGLLYKQAKQYVDNVKPLTNLPDVSIEDLVIALSTSTSLKAVELFEFVKVAASQQSDPPKSLVDIATQINDTINLRPSLWVKNDLGVLETSDVMMRNDQFVMACARNDVRKFDECLAKGQELAAIHSELKYTGLHAAADFGAIDIVEKLLLTGISPNVRDARHGRTALHFAAQSGRCAIAMLLLDKGADRTLTDFSGMVPCEIADDQGHAECREILKQVPPEIQFAQVTNCTDKTITLQWATPVTIPHLHSNIDEFMVTHEPVDSKNGSGQQYSTKRTSLTVKDLTPSTGHSFVIMSHSVSGWSKPSAKIIHFTLPAAPSAPPQVDMLKVTKNGILIAWHPPEFENGGQVDLYQIEMTDTDMIGEAYSCTESEDDSLRNDDGSSIRPDSARSDDTLGSEIFTSNKKVLRQTLVFEEEADSSVGSDANKWHRLIKHKDMSNLSKYIMGLEQYRNFYFRASCRNEFGWSNWGEWVGPYTPQEGVRVRQFGDSWVKIGWVEPRLGNGGVVNAYEVQMCMPSGPMSTKVNVYESKASRKTAKVMYEFETIDDTVRDGELVINDLKPGKKYQFRVRPMINDSWVSWDMCVLSDVISMPSSAPDVPHSVRVIRIRGDDDDDKSKVANIAADNESMVEEASTGGASGPADEEESTGSGDEDDAKSTPRSPAASNLRAEEDASDGNSESGSSENDDAMSDASSANVTDDKPENSSVGASGSVISNVDAHFAGLNDELAVTHNSIDIEWVNGIPNGSAIVEVEVQCCKVREYRVSDIEKAGKAAGKEETWDEIVYSMNSKDALNWVNISRDGEFLSAQSFRAKNLVSGAGYAFRIRQRNDVHWSSFSRATPIITTLLAAPPMAPEVIMISSAHVVAQWRMPVDSTFAFSTLQHDVRISAIQTEGSSHETLLDNPLAPNDDNLRWKRADVRDCVGSKTAALDVGHVDRVIIDSLAPMTTYVIRVRILTVAGWTTWSAISIPFRTLSLP
jgi:hypothetical protein